MDRVYLDTCVWCRPFDEPAPRITKDVEALHRILTLADIAEIGIISSSICLFEASMIENAEKRDAVLALMHNSATGFVNMTPEIERTAVEIIDECRLDSMDEAHISAALQSNAYIFLTTDDELIAKSDCISRFGINVNNPVDYVKAVKI